MSLHSSERGRLPHRCVPPQARRPAPPRSFWSPSSWAAGRRPYLVETHFKKRKEKSRMSEDVSGGSGELMKFRKKGQVNSPLQDDISLDDHLQLVGNDLTVGIVLIFTVETQRKKKKKRF